MSNSRFRFQNSLLCLICLSLFPQELPSSAEEISPFQKEEATRQAEAQQLLKEAELARKIYLADQIVSARQTASRREFTAAYRNFLKGKLMAQPVAALEQFSMGQPVPDAVVNGGTANLAFTPVAPCRVIDTRLAGGAIPASGVRAFRVTGSNFSSQGGTSGSCNVPFGPTTAVLINITATGFFGPGFLTAYAFNPNNASPPNASVVNYGPVANLPAIANAIAIPTCNSVTTSCAQDIYIAAGSSGSEVVVDVVGYFQLNETVGRTATALSTATTNLGSSCVNYPGASLTLTVPSSGRIVVEATTQLQIFHTNSSTSEMFGYIGTNLTDCSSSSAAEASRYTLSSSAASGTYYDTIPASRVFNVSPGTYSYYLNGTGNNKINYWYANMRATFIPNP